MYRAGRLHKRYFYSYYVEVCYSVFVHCFIEGVCGPTCNQMKCTDINIINLLINVYNENLQSEVNVNDMILLSNRD